MRVDVLAQARMKGARYCTGARVSEGSSSRVVTDASVPRCKQAQWHMAWRWERMGGAGDTVFPHPFLPTILQRKQDPLK